METQQEIFKKAQIELNKLMDSLNNPIKERELTQEEQDLIKKICEEWPLYKETFIYLI